MRRQEEEGWASPMDMVRLGVGAWFSVWLHSSVALVALLFMVVARLPGCDRPEISRFAPMPADAIEVDLVEAPAEPLGLGAAAPVAPSPAEEMPSPVTAVPALERVAPGPDRKVTIANELSAPEVKALDELTAKEVGVLAVLASEGSAVSPVDIPGARLTRRAPETSRARAAETGRNRRYAIVGPKDSDASDQLEALVGAGLAGLDGPERGGGLYGNVYGNGTGESFNGPGGLGLRAGSSDVGGVGTGEGRSRVGAVAIGGRSSEAGAGIRGGSSKGEIVDVVVQASAPRVTFGATRVVGSLAADNVSRPLRRRLATLRACYAKGIEKDPKLAGRVELSIAVDAEGNLSSVTEVPHDPEHDQGTTLGDPIVVRCMVQAVEKLRSVTAPVSGEATATVTFQLSPS
jgi:hypothetical protein